ncbi:hypothetical protein D3C72_946660 [compost metagenome]
MEISRVIGVSLPLTAIMKLLLQKVRLKLKLEDKKQILQDNKVIFGLAIILKMAL